MKKIKLAVVDDHTLFRKGVISLLHEFEEMDVIIESANGKDLIEQMKDNLPDVVLLDLEMPEMDGFETTAFLQKKYPDIKIIIITQHNSEEFIVYLVEHGARGFLLKNNDIEIIVDAIYSVIENGYYFNDAVSKAMVKGLVKAKKIKPSFNKVNLTERELEILILVTKEYGNIEIGEKLNIDAKTVDNHKQNIIKKTNSKNIIGAVIYAVKNDLLE